MKLSKQDSLNILDDDSEDFEKIIDEIVDTSRWSIQYELIAKEKKSGKFFRAFYQVGATEQQDESPWEWEDVVEWKEVQAVEKVVTAYEAVKDAA